MAADTRPKIACFGAAHVDRIARGLGPITWRSSNPVSITAAHGGVARNIACNLAMLGCDVALASAFGDDAEGRAVLAALEAAGVDISATLRCDNAPTATYTAVLGPDGDLEIGLADMAIYEALTPDHCLRVGERMASRPVWLIDANLHSASIAALAEAAPGTVYGAAVSPAKAPRLEAAFGQLSGVFANRAESAALTGRAIETPADALAAAEALRGLGAGVAFITLGERGAAVAGDGIVEAIANPPTHLRDANGAGDAFAAGALDAIVRGRSLRDVLVHGLALASLTAEEDGPVVTPFDPGRLAGRVAQIGEAA